MRTTVQNNAYQVGISTQILNAVYAYQEKEYWCWTASITNILRAYGIRNISQEDFAQNICGVDLWGNACNCPATTYEITRSLNFRGHDQYYSPFRVEAPLHLTQPKIDKLYEELSAKRPILVAYGANYVQMGHAVIITGCECEIRGGGTYVTKLFLRDPAPNALNKLFNGRKEVTDVPAFLKTVYAHWYVSIYK